MLRQLSRVVFLRPLGRAFEALARQARDDGWTHEEYLYEVLAAEITSRADSAVRRRFIPFDRAGGELLFNLLTARYEHGAVIVTTNLAFSEWPQVFAGDEKLATALIDRLADRGTIITTKGKSFRLRRRRSGASITTAAADASTSTGPSQPEMREP